MRMLSNGRSRQMATLTLTVALAAFATACASDAARHDSGAAESQPPVAVTVAPAVEGDLPTTYEAGGVIRARTTVAIAARVMTPVLAVTVRPGDRVRRGATLVTLDARELAAQAARGKATVQAAEEAARAATAQEGAADAQLTLARATYDRISGLFEKKSATAQERDQA
ncbi:MAG: hypothetical protein AB7N65_19485, partial [Vicinamibacterales bacterium]